MHGKHTAPLVKELVMSGVDLSSRLRRLAHLSEVKLGLFYTIGVLPATLLGEFATVQPGFEWLTAPAAAVGLCALSALIAVLTFYRDDDALLAGAILSVITGVGSVMAWALAVVATTRSLGAVIVAAAGGALIFPLHLILMALLFAGLVWILRKFRRWLAPDTSVDS